MRVCSTSALIFAASTTSAASVGSPMIVSSSATVASLQSESPRASRLKSGGSDPATPRILPVLL